MDWSKLRHAILEFLKAEKGYEALEFWLDTSVARVAPNSPSMYLVFHAFHSHGNLDLIFDEIEKNQDISLLEDNTKKCTEQIWFELAIVDPKLSSGLHFVEINGLELIFQEIQSLSKAEAPLFNTFSKVFLHWVDQPEIKWIKK